MKGKDIVDAFHRCPNKDYQSQGTKRDTDDANIRRRNT